MYFLLDTLEEIEVILEKGEDYEIELIKYLLENSKALRKMSILYNCQLLRKPFSSVASCNILKKGGSSLEVYVLAQ